jgi:hypothetical protein
MAETKASNLAAEVQLAAQNTTPPTWNLWAVQIRKTRGRKERPLFESRLPGLPRECGIMFFSSPFVCALTVFYKE